jgi:uncharacterized protein (DUF934 family)
MIIERESIIRNRSVVPNDWRVLHQAEGIAPEAVDVPVGRVIVPLKVWQAQREKLQGRAELGVWLDSDERAEELADDLERFAVIAVNFPKFADGRGYSIAYRLRVRLGYRGELRAIGDVLRDQLFYMRRAGFDAFEPRADRDIHEALKGLSDFSVTYQASADEAQPLFRRVQRGGAA